MVMNSAWSKNNRRELKKTLGRFLAIVAIVGLGVSMFIGLKSAKPTMVKTCNVYLEDTNFYDLQLISSIGFDRGEEDAFRDLEGVAAVEGTISADMLAVLDGNEVVFKTHMLMPSINQVHVTAGRTPRTSGEILADDLTFSEADLGKTMTVIHQDDTVFAKDEYTIVGLCNSPQYLNMARGSTSLGNGSVKGFLFLPREGYNTDYWTELYVRLDTERDLFDTAYQDYLKTWEDPLVEILEPQGEARLDRLLAEGRKELDDGWEEYNEASKEYWDTKAEVQAELEDAAAQLEDAAKQLEDGRKELEDGEAQLEKLLTNPYSIPEIASAKAQLEDGRKQLEDGEAQYEEGMKQYKSMAVTMEYLLSKAENALYDATVELNNAQAAYDEALKEFNRVDAYVRGEYEKLQAPIDEANDALNQARADLAQKQTALETLEQSGADADVITQARVEVEAVRAEIVIRQTAVDTAQAAYDTEAALLDAQLDAARGAMELAQSVLNAARAPVDRLTATVEDYKQQLEDAELQLLEASIQLEDARRQLAEGEAALQNEIANAIATAQTALEDGKQQLAEGEQEYADGLKEYEDGKAEAEQEFTNAEKELQDAYRELREAELELGRMELPSYYVLTPSSNNGFISFDNDTNIVDAIAGVFPIFFLLVAALVCSSTMSRMVEEQRTQNGTMKALGYSDGKIMLRYAAYAGYAAIVGTVIGLLLGTYLFPFVIWEAYKILYHFGELEYLFSWGMAAIATAAALLCCCGAACAAAWHDLQLMPAQLMRPKAPKAGKRIFLEHITPLWNSLSFLAKVSLRNIFRYRKRLFMMLLGTGGCLALLLTGLGLRDSIANVADDQFSQITMYDYAVTFADHQTEDMRAEFQAEFADRLSHCVFAGTETLDVPTGRGIKSVSFVASSDPAMDDILGLTWEGKDLGYPTGDGLYVSHSLAEDAGLKVGDLLPVQLESKALLEIPITGIFTNYVSHYAYLTEEGYLTWFGIEPEIKTAFATAPEEQLYEVNAALQNYEGVLSVSMVQDAKDMVANAVGSLDAIIILVVACASALAFVVGYNLININITERVREIATIKVLGFYQKETHDYVFRESIILTLMGTVVGVPLGIWLHRFIMSVVKVDFVCFQVQISPMSFAIGIAVTILVTLIVNQLLGKKIDRINMAESLKSVE